MSDRLQPQEFLLEVLQVPSLQSCWQHNHQRCMVARTWPRFKPWLWRRKSAGCIPRACRGRAMLAVSTLGMRLIQMGLCTSVHVHVNNGNYGRSESSPLVARTTLLSWVVQRGGQGLFTLAVTCSICLNPAAPVLWASETSVCSSWTFSQWRDSLGEGLFFFQSPLQGPKFHLDSLNPTQYMATFLAILVVWDLLPVFCGYGKLFQ